MGCGKMIVIFLVTSFIAGGCVTSPEADWRNRRAVLEMRPSELPGVVGSLTVAGEVDGYAFTKDSLWIVTAVPTKRWLPVNRLAKVDLNSNRFTDLYAVDGFAGAALAVGYDSIWLTEGLGAEKLHRIDSSTGQIVASIVFPRNPISVVAGEGGVWVLAAESVSTFGPIRISVNGLALYKIDPKNNTITNVISLPLKKVPPFPKGSRISLGTGSIWVSISEGAVFKVDPTTNKILKTFATPQEAMVSDPTYERIASEEKDMVKRATAILGSPVYAVASGMGTSWAFTHGGKAGDKPSPITWIMRLNP